MPVIIFTAFATIESAVAAVKDGAFDYLPKPFSADQLRLSVEKVLKEGVHGGTFRSDLDPEALAAFQARIRKRYSDEELLAELRGCAERLGRSPTMREFAADSETRVHPQTVIEHFGSWNAAKREAGLVPRRFATREELLQCLRELGEKLGRTPTARDLAERRGSLPSKSLYWHTFGSLSNALREAGFDMPVGEERLERAVEQGLALARRLGRLPKFADWAEARRADETLLTEWQVYRMFDARRGAWSTFQFLIRERLREADVEVTPEGRLR
jgi:CheY-like chemotaxis protein